MDDLEGVGQAIAALTRQRAVLGDAVVETALGPLLQRRRVLTAQQAGGQRKLVTVPFADLVDFTVLSTKLDAEDTRSVINDYFRLWNQTIEAHGGVVEKFIGDAVMAVFGCTGLTRATPSSRSGPRWRLRHVQGPIGWAVTSSRSAFRTCGSGDSRPAHRD